MPRAKREPMGISNKMADPKLEHKARRLQELFRGRFNQEVAERLITEFGGEAQAVDFLMNEDPEQVSRFLKETPEYLDSLRRDSEKVGSLLENGPESSVRQFACADCDRSWWRRVPKRKEVSRCRRCHVKFDPIPRDKEWGVGKFLCQCGNEFTGSAVMGLTKSQCYKCGESVEVDHMVPPRKNRQRKTPAPHSCDAPNCYNCPSNLVDSDQEDDWNFNDFSGWNKYRPQPHDNDQSDQSYDKEPGAYPDPPPEPVCIHPKSRKPPRRRIRTASLKHVSTGSTVATFLSQGSLETNTVSVAYTLATISEDD